MFNFTIFQFISGIKFTEVEPWIEVEKAVPMVYTPAMIIPNEDQLNSVDLFMWEFRRLVSEIENDDIVHGSEYLIKRIRGLVVPYDATFWFWRLSTTIDWVTYHKPAPDAKALHQQAVIRELAVEKLYEMSFWKQTWELDGVAYYHILYRAKGTNELLVHNLLRKGTNLLTRKGRDIDYIINPIQ